MGGAAQAYVDLGLGLPFDQVALHRVLRSPLVSWFYEPQVRAQLMGCTRRSS